MTKLSMFEWDDEFSDGSGDYEIGAFHNQEIDLSDAESARLANRILDELKEGHHVTLRIDSREGKTVDGVFAKSEDLESN